MRAIMLHKILFFVLFLSLSFSPVKAEGWYYVPMGNGLFQKTDYTTNDGWYYKRYRTCGCRGTCNHPYTYRQFARVDSYTPGTEGWRTTLLNLVAARDRAEARLRESANEQNEFIESIRALGLEGNFSWSGYGSTPTYASGAGEYGATNPNLGAPLLNQLGIPGMTGYQPFAAQGNTVYGFNQFSSNYGNVDLASLYNQASRLATQAQTLAGQAAVDFSALITDHGTHQAEIAKILAQADAAAKVLIAAKGDLTPSAQPRTFVLSGTVSPQGEVTVQPYGITSSSSYSSTTIGDPQLAAMGSQLVAVAPQVIINRCVVCHSKENASGALDLSEVASWGVEQRNEWGKKIVLAVTNPDVAKRMPLGPDKTPGQALPPAELLSILTFFQ